LLWHFERLDLILERKSPERIVLIGGGSRSTGWRQLLSDATGVAIVIPLEEEAGCLGASLQAMYAYKHQQCDPQLFSSITERCVRMDDTKTAIPRPELFYEYCQAIESYKMRMPEFYPAR
jgi:xylulokinase